MLGDVPLGDSISPLVNSCKLGPPDCTWGDDSLEAASREGDNTSAGEGCITYGTLRSNAWEVED